MKLSYTIILALALPALSAVAGMPEYTEITAAVPAVDNGTAHRYSVNSESLGADMLVDVWLPETYDPARPSGYPVLYVHDGQNIFDPSLSFAGVAWEMDRTAASLAASGGIEAPIIVGIHNRGSLNLRASDYFPEKALEYIADSDRGATAIYATCGGRFLGDEHAAFVALELKPLIDGLFNTDQDASHTFAIGSSMGALASMYLLCEYPGVFGGAACLSTHWIGSLDLNSDYTMNDDPVCAGAILDYLAGHLPVAAALGPRIYMDQGTEGWDSGYLGYEAQARRIVRGKGYSDGGTLMCHDATGAGHNEWYWQQRADKPLAFLLDKDKMQAGVIQAAAGASGSDRVYVNLAGVVFLTDNAAALAPGIYIRSGRKIVVR